MLEKIKVLAEAHPQLIVGLAAMLVGVAVNEYARTVEWAHNVEQLRASEFYGG